MKIFSYRFHFFVLLGVLIFLMVTLVYFEVKRPLYEGKEAGLVPLPKFWNWFVLKQMQARASFTDPNTFEGEIYNGTPYYVEEMLIEITVFEQGYWELVEEPPGRKMTEEERKKPKTFEEFMNERLVKKEINKKLPVPIWKELHSVSIGCMPFSKAEFLTITFNYFVEASQMFGWRVVSVKVREKKK